MRMGNRETARKKEYRSAQNADGWKLYRAFGGLKRVYTFTCDMYGKLNVCNGRPRQNLTKMARDMTRLDVKKALCNFKN